jgi:hypothetical protein
MAPKLTNAQQLEHDTAFELELQDFFVFIE